MLNVTSLIILVIVNIASAAVMSKPTFNIGINKLLSIHDGVFFWNMVLHNAWIQTDSRL